MLNDSQNWGQGVSKCKKCVHVCVLKYTVLQKSEKTQEIGDLK